MRIAIKKWEDVRSETASVALKMDLHIAAGVLDATVLGYWQPTDGYYEINPQGQQDHARIKEIFYDWEQVRTQRHWDDHARYWFIFTHPENQLPCIVEWYAFPDSLRDE